MQVHGAPIGCRALDQQGVQQRPVVQQEGADGARGGDVRKERYRSRTERVGISYSTYMYKYIIKLLNDITVFTCLVKVRKTNSLKLGPAALRP